MDADSRNTIREQETMIKKLKDELSSMKDVIRAQEKELQPFLCKIKALERQLEEYRNESAFHRLREEYEGIILELRRENRKLTAQVNRNFE